MSFRSSRAVWTQLCYWFVRGSGGLALVDGWLADPIGTVRYDVATTLCCYRCWLPRELRTGHFDKLSQANSYQFVKFMLGTRSLGAKRTLSPACTAGELSHFVFWGMS